jgi:glycine/D-amino acid oxidase-like deaminating enzyme
MVRAVVLGGGVIGLECARRLAVDGFEVDLFERETIGHERASSHGDVRMRVPAAFPHADYARRGQVAEQVWRDLERSSGRRLLTDVGCLFWGDATAGLGEALAGIGEPHEALTPEQVERRWGLRLPGPATWQPRAGHIDAGTALEVLARAALDLGVRIHERTEVSVAGEPVDATVVVAGARWPCDVVVVAAGAWSRSLLRPLDLALEVRSTAQTVAYFDVEVDRLPGLIQYGDPDPYACPVPGVGLKAAFHAPGAPSADDQPGRVDPEAVAAVRRWVEQVLGRPAPLLGARACRYTWTADEAFLVERHGSLVVVSACSGHGFQYAPDTAARVVDLVRADG